MTLEHATPKQLAAAFRERYRNAKGVEAARLARKVKDLLDDGTLTSADLRAAFDMTTAQLSAFSARLDTRATRYDVMIAEVGE